MSATVGELVRSAASRLAQSGSETARLDAEVLLGHVLGIDRATLLAAPEAGVGPQQAATFEALVERRADGEPVAYLRGLKEFYGIALAVDPRALIPRPETERLVELALERIAAMLTSAARPPGTPPLRVWDVGTGSGAIAVSVAVESRQRRYAADLRLLASDVYEDALGLAVENAVAHGVADIIEFRPCDLVDLPGAPVADLLLANLPYIRSDELPRLPVAASFEPRIALDGGVDGLRLIDRLLKGLPGALAAKGVALLEIGSDEADAMRELVGDRLPGWRLQIWPDLAGQPRVAELQRSSAE